MSTLKRVDQRTYDAIRGLVLDDPFEFAQIVCGHTDLSDETHRPLVYLAAGCGDKLIQVLNDETQTSFVVQHLRKRFVNAGADWRTDTGRLRFFELLNFVNIRVFRGAAKSSAITHAVTLWLSTREPNLSQAIITNADDKAKDWCKQIRETVRSEVYGQLFPERVPLNPNDMTESSIRLNGRTSPDKESCIMAFGYKSSPTGYHWDRILPDDLIGRENRSPNEIARAIEFMTGLPFLMNPGKRFTPTRCHVGTRWDEEDDDFVLRRMDHCFSIDVPVEYYPDGAPEDIRTPGIPTCPEWADEPKIREVKDTCLADPDKGALEYRANYLLDPTIAGGRLFSRELIDRCLWTPVKIEEEGGRQQREDVARPLYDDKTREPLLNAKGEHRYGTAHRSQLRFVLGVDQSVSMEMASDEWSVVALAEDSSGVCYEMETRAGHGYEGMLDAIVHMNTVYRPRLIGIEKGGMQNTTHYWIEKNDRFRHLKSRVVGISHNNREKEWRLMNGIAEPMKAKQLYLNPRSTELHGDMVKYRPGPKAKDGKLDALAIAMATSKRPANSKNVLNDVRKWNRKRREQYANVV